MFFKLRETKKGKILFWTLKKQIAYLVGVQEHKGSCDGLERLPFLSRKTFSY